VTFDSKHVLGSIWSWSYR